MVITILYFIGLISGVIAVIFTGGPKTSIIIATILLQYYLLISVGISSIIGFIGHVFRGEIAARLLGWPSGNPFQKELGFYDGAAGVAAILCFWHHGEFWLATIIIITIFWVLAGCLHLKHVLKEKNYHIDNALPAIMDFIVPITLVILYRIATK
jgi:Family of unknown function (DUF6790)